LGEFLKIFFVLCAVVAAFFVGKGYGEKTYLASEDYKNIAKTREDLDYARNELENAKAKLQNIIDRGDKEKTEELLGKILQVFLADLGLQIQNRDALIENAKKSSSSFASAGLKKEKAPEIITTAAVDSPAETKSPSRKDLLEEKNLRQLKSNEWMLVNSDFSQKLLNKVVIKNLKKYLSTADPVVDDCDAFLGRYSGSFHGEDGSLQGFLTFELNNENGRYNGSITWKNSPKFTISSDISGNCGLKSELLQARLFQLPNWRFLQVYKSANREELSGILYEILPAGTTHMLGSFHNKKSQ
jgi:hypothetical protein